MWFELKMRSDPDLTVVVVLNGFLRLDEHSGDEEVHVSTLRGMLSGQTSSS